MKKLLLAAFVFGLIMTAGAQTPRMFRYQGRLVDGTNLVNATLPMSFKLYNALSEGTLLYEDSNSVLVVDGLYSTMIGDDTAFGSLTNALTNATVYLELTVDGETLSPREQLVSVPYALNVPASIPAPVVGDPSAVSNEVINSRWMKNTYANDDITMSDGETGLMWLYDANLGGATNWAAAGSYCDNLTYAGYADWRLPSLNELRLLSFYSEHFAGVQDNYYWSGMSLADPADYAWYVYMENGDADAYRKTSSGCVWPVRGGQ